jgi:hypothetical protein
MPQNSDLKQLALMCLSKMISLIVRRQEVEEVDGRSVALEGVAAAVQINTDRQLECPRSLPREALNSSRRESMTEVSLMDMSLQALPILLRVYWQLVLLMIRGCGVVRWTRRRANP